MQFGINRYKQILSKTGLNKIARARRASAIIICSL